MGAYLGQGGFILGSWLRWELSTGQRALFGRYFGTDVCSFHNLVVLLAHAQPCELWIRGKSQQYSGYLRGCRECTRPTRCPVPFSPDCPYGRTCVRGNNGLCMTLKIG